MKGRKHEKKEDMSVNKIVIICGPSAVGKTRVINHICKNYLNFERLISYTTREKRAEEKEGIDYYFISEEKFNDMLSQDKFFEISVNAFGSYGISKDSVISIRQKNKHIIFDCDVDGYKLFKSQLGDKCIGIFLMPNSYEELYKQLLLRGEKRGIKNEEDFNLRWGKNLEIINQACVFDTIIVNDQIELTAGKIVEMISLDKSEK